jgi:hypothetical protein
MPLCFARYFVGTIVWPWSYAEQCQPLLMSLCFAFRSAAKAKIYRLIYIVPLRTLVFFMKEVLFWSSILVSRWKDLSGQVSKSNTVPSLLLFWLLLWPPLGLPYVLTFIAYMVLPCPFIHVNGLLIYSCCIWLPSFLHYLKCELCQSNATKEHRFIVCIPTIVLNDPLTRWPFTLQRR